MNRLRYLAASLLCLSGIIPVGRFGMADAPAVIVVGFGLVYLAVAGLLFRNSKLAYYLGGIVPAIGLGIGPIVLTDPPLLFAAFLGIIEVVAMISCLILIKSTRGMNKTATVEGE